MGEKVEFKTAKNSVTDSLGESYSFEMFSSKILMCFLLIAVVYAANRRNANRTYARKVRETTHYRDPRERSLTREPEDTPGDDKYIPPEGASTAEAGQWRQRRRRRRRRRSPSTSSDYSDSSSSPGRLLWLDHGL